MLCFEVCTLIDLWMVYSHSEKCTKRFFFRTWNSDKMFFCLQMQADSWLNSHPNSFALVSYDTMIESLYYTQILALIFLRIDVFRIQWEYSSPTIDWVIPLLRRCYIHGIHTKNNSKTSRYCKNCPTLRSCRNFIFYHSRAYSEFSPTPILRWLQFEWTMSWNGCVRATARYVLIWWFVDGYQIEQPHQPLNGKLSSSNCSLSPSLACWNASQIRNYQNEKIIILRVLP